MIMKMVNQTQQTVQKQPELKVEKTNYGWRVRLPRTSENVVIYEAHRFSIPFLENLTPLEEGNVGKFGLTRIEISSGGYKFCSAVYQKMEGSWWKEWERATGQFILNINYARNSLEARAFDLLLQAKD